MARRGVLTTQDKLNVIRQAREPPKQSPKKTPKNPRTLPPPAEYAAMLKEDESRRAQKEKDQQDKKLQRQGAMTTSEKLEKTRTKAIKKSIKKTERKTSLMAFLDGLSSTERRVDTDNERVEPTATPSLSPFTSSDPNISGVLVRPTARTRFLKAEKSSRKPRPPPVWSQGFSTSNDLSALRDGQTQPSEKKSEQPFRFLDLPSEIRQRVYRHAVVQANSFVWPITSELDREQPDLAMVSRLVRQEVLRVFYSENRFAFTLASMHKGRTEQFRKRNEELTKKWISAMSTSNSKDGQWLRDIKKFAFEGMSTTDQKLEFVICVTATTQLERAADHENSIEATNEGVQVEIHRQAACILPCFKSIVGPCTQALLPDGILRAVHESMAKHPPLIASPQGLTSLLGRLNDKSNDAAVASCIGEEMPGAQELP